jgi:hypothetical protein
MRAAEVAMHWQDVRVWIGSMRLCNSQLIHIQRQDTADCRGANEVLIAYEYVTHFFLD